MAAIFSNAGVAENGKNGYQSSLYRLAIENNRFSRGIPGRLELRIFILIKPK